jgi:hypothetical protein
LDPEAHHLTKDDFMNIKGTAHGVMAALAVAGTLSAAEIRVNTNIAGSVTWTANNTYNLQRQIYVLPGATLTIQAGTVVASTTNLGGSLAVVAGAQIFVLGDRDRPVIMTSTADVATWGRNGDPVKGTWYARAERHGAAGARAARERGARTLAPEALAAAERRLAEDPGPEGP